MTLRRFIFEDFWLKLFSLGVALLIWASVHAAVDTETTLSLAPIPGSTTRPFLNCPVFVVSLAADVREFKVKPSHVDVTVRGDAATLDKLQPKDIHVLVDLTNVRASKGLRQRVEVSTPPGVTLNVRATPDEVEVIFPK
jgi:hypothetical protein